MGVRRGCRDGRRGGKELLQGGLRKKDLVALQVSVSDPRGVRNIERRRPVQVHRLFSHIVACGCHTFQQQRMLSIL